MKKSQLAIIIAGLAAGTLLSAPVFADTVALSDTAMDAIAGKANTYTFSSDQSATLAAGSDASANIQFDWYQWTDDHSTDGSLDKGANNQSGASSNVQSTITTTANGIVWGALAQNTVVNTEGTPNAGIGGTQSNMAYGVFANGGF
jgi:hypothetical protein